MKGTTRKINSQEGGLINFLDPLIRIILPLIKNAHTSLAKIVLIPLWLKVLETDAAIQNNYRLGMRPSNLAKQNLLIISNEEAKDIMKIVKSIKKSGLMWKGVSEIICNEAKEQKVLSIRMLLGTLAATLLGSMLPGKGVIWTCEGQGKIRAGQGF